MHMNVAEGTRHSIELAHSIQRPSLSGAAVAVVQPDGLRSSGTLSCCVVKKDGTHWGLTSQHVLNPQGLQVTNGLRVLQPPFGELIGTSSELMENAHFQYPGPVIVDAHVLPGTNFDNLEVFYVDAGLIATNPRSAQTGLHPSLDWSWEKQPFPQRVRLTSVGSGRSLQPDTVVYKQGAATGLGKGVTKPIGVAQYYAAEGMKDDGEKLRADRKRKTLIYVSECVFVNPAPSFPCFSKKGDSGSLVFTVDEKNGEGLIVGLLCGGNDKVSFVAFIEEVLNALDVSVCFEDHGNRWQAFRSFVGRLWKS